MPWSPSPSPEFKLDSTWNPHWNPYVIALVGAVCTVFLFLSYYRTLRQCFRFSFRSHPRRRLLNEANLDDPSSLQFPSRGLDSAILHTLPAIQFRKKIGGETGESTTDCAVCLGEFVDGEWLRLLPNCVHVFHISCIDAWFRSHSNCPICRSNVDSHSDHSLSMFTLMETLRRDDAVRDRAVRYQVLRSEIMQNLAVRWGATNNNHHESSSDESFVSTVSSSAVKNNHQKTDGVHEEDYNLKKKGSSSRDGHNNQDLQGSSSTTEEFQEPP